MATNKISLRRWHTVLPGLALWFLVGATYTLHAASLVSEPVGCVRVVIPGSATGQTTCKVLGIPFNRPSVFRGIVTAVSGATLKAGTPAWTSGQFVSQPHYLKLRTGPSGVSFAEKQVFEIFPAQTLGSLFGTSSVPLRTGTSEADADFVRIHNGTSWESYFHTGAQWQLSGGTSSQNGLILRPEQGILLFLTMKKAVSTMLELCLKIIELFMPRGWSGLTLSIRRVFSIRS